MRKQIGILLQYVGIAGLMIFLCTGCGGDNGIQSKDRPELRINVTSLHLSPGEVGKIIVGGGRYPYESAVSADTSVATAILRDDTVYVVAVREGTTSVTIKDGDTYSKTVPVTVYAPSDPKAKDDDGDGYTEYQGDCNDSNPAIHPGIAEICGDGIDQNCNGTDIPCQNTIDNDGDGYTEVQGDCNDDDSSIYPGAEEFPNDGIDQNCDGGDKVTVVSDRDGDGYTTNQGDCNDNNPSIHPNAAEIPGDGIDQDCSGSDLTVSDNDKDKDGYTTEQGDCNDSNAAIHPGANDLCGDGADQNCDGKDPVCPDPEVAENTFTEVDTEAEAVNPRSVVLETGTTIAVVLPGSPSQGYAWGITSAGSGVLEKTGNFYTADCDTSECGGKETWTFKVIREGSAQLKMIYYPVWAGQTSVKDTFTLNVRTRSNTALNDYIKRIDTDYGYGIAVTLSGMVNHPELGGRNSGSEAEHAAADFLVQKMKDIGLSDVQKESFRAAKWQFNSAELTVVSPGGQSRVIKPYPYSAEGTGPEGITAELVYVGKGTRDDYTGKDVKDKIVLADIDMRSDWWITYPTREAQLHGAAAIISSCTGGFAQISKDALNTQNLDVASGISSLNISVNDAEYLKGLLNRGSVTVHLNADNEIEPNGTSYNIVGKIPGRDADELVIVGAHYDQHFHGFQDDSCGAGLVLAMAKAMIASKYKPERTLVFILHGAEEWGAIDSFYNWSVGTWNQLNTLHPEWAGKAVAYINSELPAYPFSEKTYTASTPELYSFIREFETSAPQPVNSFPGGFVPEGVSQTARSGDWAYTAAGIPALVNGFMRDPETGRDVYPFYYSMYHTQYDTSATFDRDVFAFNLRFYGAMAMAFDQKPVLALDFTRQTSRVRNAVNKNAFATVSYDSKPLLNEIDALAAVAGEKYARIQDVNKLYAEMLASANADGNFLAAIRKAGKIANVSLLKAFRLAQDGLLKLAEEKTLVGHELPQENIILLSQAIENLKTGNVKYVTDNLLWAVDSSFQRYNYYFSKEVTDQIADQLFGEAYSDKRFWASGKLVEYSDMYDTIQALMRKYREGGEYSGEIATLETALQTQKTLLDKTVSEEIAALRAVRTELEKINLVSILNQAANYSDDDGDGYTAGQGDCDDHNAAIHPGGTDFCGDGIDQDCDGADLACTPEDKDNDGFTGIQGDCNDFASSVYPGAQEICGDGIDQNCDGYDPACNPRDIDNDRDGYTENQGDCNDSDASVSPGIKEICGDGMDQNCDGHDLECSTDENSDADGDGYTKAEGDCDDTSANIHPGAIDICNDGIDQDCDGDTVRCDPMSTDNDGDGYTGHQGDCNDSNPGIHPVVLDICGDGIDQDCNGEDALCDPSFTDHDGDGYTERQGDCNDNDPAVYPGSFDFCGDGIDQDCDGNDFDCDSQELDNDGDGYSEAQGDCNDNNAAVYPGAFEICGDGTDQNCDGNDPDCGFTPADYDRDGYTEAQGDCNDYNYHIHPGAEEVCGDNIDQDCDGKDSECNPTGDYDRDGYTEAQGDCNDYNYHIRPGAEEICGDNIDQDCDGKDTECNPTGDYDRDGYTEAQGDCNDYNYHIRPGAEEICGDNIDQDCDGKDSECSGDTDQDADGYSQAEGDCDDNDSGIHPGAAEYCGDGIDQNCDGKDTVCSSAGDIDYDRDGYTENQGDCNDYNYSIRPGAEEVCGDNVDQDCDGKDLVCGK